MPYLLIKKFYPLFIAISRLVSAWVLGGMHVQKQWDKEKLILANKGL